MQYSRRQFLALSASVPAILASYRFGFLRPNSLHGLRGDTGFFTERGGTIGWFASGETVVIVDAQFPDTAKIFHEQLQLQGHGNLGTLINTHHHGDHTAGNVYFKPLVSRIVAHQNAVILQQKRYEGTPDAANQVYADTTFERDWAMEAGSERITARYFGPAHTGGDIVVHFEKANVTHLGDLVFNNVYPVLDVDRGGTSIPGWISVLEQVVGTLPSDTIYIFGHSTDDQDVTGSSEALLRMRDYLTALENHVRSHKKSGKSVDDIVALGPIPKFEHLKERRKGAFKHNIESAFKVVE